MLYFRLINAKKTSFTFLRKILMTVWIMTIWIITSWPYSPSRSPWWWRASPRTMSMVEWRDSTTTWNPACSTSHFSCLMFCCLLHQLLVPLVPPGNWFTWNCDSQAASVRRTASTRVENMISWGSGRLGGMTESDAEGWKLWQGRLKIVQLYMFKI